MTRPVPLAIALFFGAIAPVPAQPSAAPFTPAAEVTVPEPKRFVDEIAGWSRFMLETSRLAMDRSQDEATRGYAQRAVGEQRRVSDDLVAATRRAGVMVPDDSFDAEQRAMLDRLRTAEGPAFDKAFAEAQITVYRRVKSLIEAFATHGDNQALRTFARETLPHVEAQGDAVTRLANR